MKEHVKDIFDQVTMPAGCEQKVLRAMADKAEGKTTRNARPALRPATVFAAALALVLFVSAATNNKVQAAMNDLVRYVFGGASFIQMDTETGDIISLVSYPTQEGDPAGVFVEISDGRMYFGIHGEYIDITDKTSMETPYIHTYVDGDNIEHILIIGGTPDNFGVSEFYREKVEGQQDWEGWVGGYSENHIDNETGKAYPWLAAAWEERNLPWPIPGA